MLGSAQCRGIIVACLCSLSALPAEAHLLSCTCSRPLCPLPACPQVGESSGATADFLENTLWNRTLGTTSEEIVAALVCQIFEGALSLGGGLGVLLRLLSWAMAGCLRGSCLTSRAPLPCQRWNSSSTEAHLLPHDAASHHTPSSPPSRRPRSPRPAGIRDHFVQSVELKFNCFFLMPIIDTFPTRLREELESAYEEDLDEVGGCLGGCGVVWAGGWGCREWGCWALQWRCLGQLALLKQFAHRPAWHPVCTASTPSDHPMHADLHCALAPAGVASRRCLTWQRCVQRWSSG